MGEIVGELDLLIIRGVERIILRKLLARRIAARNWVACDVAWPADSLVGAVGYQVQSGAGEKAPSVHGSNLGLNRTQREEVADIEGWYSSGTGKTVRILPSQLACASLGRIGGVEAVLLAAIFRRAVFADVDRSRSSDAQRDEVVNQHITVAVGGRGKDGMDGRRSALQVQNRTVEGLCLVPGARALSGHPDVRGAEELDGVLTGGGRGSGSDADSRKALQES